MCAILPFAEKEENFFKEGVTFMVVQLQYIDFQWYTGRSGLKG